MLLGKKKNLEKGKEKKNTVIKNIHWGKKEQTENSII